MRKNFFVTNEGATKDQDTMDNKELVSETTGEGPENTRQTNLNTTETVQVTTQTSQQRLDNNFQELHLLSEDILSDYRSIGRETGPKEFEEDLVREQTKHDDFQTKILDNNADLKKTSAENTIAPVIAKEIIANDNAIIADQGDHMKDLDKLLEDKKYNPYEKEEGYGIQVDLVTKKHRRDELLAEREEYLRTRNLELQVLIDNAREGVRDPELESDFDINERSESDLDFESEDSDMYGPAPEHRREESESEIKKESPSIKVESDSDIDLQNIPESRREESEDSDMYGPAPEIPKSNKRKFDQISQGEDTQQEALPTRPRIAAQDVSLNAGDNVNVLNTDENASPILSQIDPNVWRSSQQQISQGEGSQQQVSQQQVSQQQVSQGEGSQQEGGNKKEKKENSILDDYADVSTEPADYFGGDD